MPTDPVALTAALVRCPSVTPAEGGALVLLEDVLTKGRFHLHAGGSWWYFQSLRPLGQAGRQPDVWL